LYDTYGHVDCGIYAEVVAAGDIAVGDAIGFADEPHLI
jgi:MOSC domain-containing protein YiiM